MEGLIDHLNKRVIEINDKIENAEGSTMENLACGRMMEAEKAMMYLVNQGVAALDMESLNNGLYQIKHISFSG